MKALQDIMTIKEVLEFTGFARTRLYDSMKAGDFPQSKKLGERMVRWSKKEILRWYRDKGFDVPLEENL